MKRGLILALAFIILSLSAGGISCKSEPALEQPPEIPFPFDTYYENNIFGFKIGHSSDWEAEETDRFSPVVRIKSPEEDLPYLTVSVFYTAEVLSPAKVADSQIAGVLTLPGAKVLSEKEVELEGNPPAFEMIYSLGRGENELRGVLLAVARGSQTLIVQFFSSLSFFEEKSEELLSYMHSLRLEEPRPFGISRQESLTLFFPEPSTLDPAQATVDITVQYITQIFSGLFAFTPTMELIPDLAEEYQVSPDGKVYTFYLRPDAHFHDGKQVTAEDIKYSWERAALSGSPTALTYLGDIIGVKGVVEGNATEIRGVEVVDEKTLRVTIDAAKAYFLAKLTHPVAFVVDRSNVEVGVEQWWLKPNGTGPFRLKGWQRGIVMALERNPDYYRTPAELPYVVFRHLGISALRMYETDEIDVGFLSIDEVEEVRETNNPLAEEMKDVAQLSISLIRFNTTKPPFNDAALRQSFLLAIDRERLVDEVLKNQAEIAHGFLPPGLPAHNPELTPLPFDPEEAQRLLSQSRYTDFLQVTIAIPGYFTASPVFEALMRMWRENLGVMISVNLIAPETYYRGLDTRTGDLYVYGWIADYPDPENFLDVLFHSESANNVGKYTNSEVDRLLEEARVEPDSQIRIQLYRDVEEILRQDAAAIPLHFGREFVLIKPFIKGFIVNPQGIVDLRLVSITPH